ncbi:hypothetical protein NDU88_003328 [Pleurodeles waltl]|uniref:Uncharacterized protein n=1 Tax=Pleurodeles waltl TaxID=8319 RepID=A0AAV7UBS5_PLEWA|nr:hypothetical protein NDU88_003328 [Pleurodeles waltl]
MALKCLLLRRDFTRPQRSDGGGGHKEKGPHGPVIRPSGSESLRGGADSGKNHSEAGSETGQLGSPAKDHCGSSGGCAERLDPGQVRQVRKSQLHGRPTHRGWERSDSSWTREEVEAPCPIAGGETASAGPISLLDEGVRQQAGLEGELSGRPGRRHQPDAAAGISVGVWWAVGLQARGGTPYPGRTYTAYRNLLLKDCLGDKALKPAPHPLPFEGARLFCTE